MKLTVTSLAAERGGRAVFDGVSFAAEAGTLKALLPVGAGPRPRIAFHAPCSLQHGQKIRGVVEALLGAAGFDLTPVRDAHLCCGSAGTYSLLQPEISARLREDKLDALLAGGGECIVSANIGCIEHLSSAATRPVRHWIELVDENVTDPGRKL